MCLRPLASLAVSNIACHAVKAPSGFDAAAMKSRLASWRAMFAVLAIECSAKPPEPMMP